MKNRISIILLFILAVSTLRAQDFRVISSSTTSITIEYLPVFLDTSVIDYNGSKFTRLNLAYGVSDYNGRTGMADIPFRELNVGVPAESGNTIQVISSEFSVLQGRLAPVPTPFRDSVGARYEYIPSASYAESNPSDLVAFGEFGMVRELPVQTIRIFPVRYDAQSEKITLYKRIVFRINFPPSSASAAQPADPFLSETVINWNAAGKWVRPASALRKGGGPSVLASGNWYRFETPAEGIYKIDRNFLQNLGIDLNSVDPTTIKIYGDGGYQMPENPGAARPSDIVENAIIVNGESDGKFDAADYILFYGRNTEFWEYSSAARKVVRVKHPFTNKNYYWLTYGGAKGKRVASKPSLSQAGAYSQQWTYAYKWLDEDKTKIPKQKTGRDYYGDEFTSSTKSRTYLNTLNGIIPGTRINYNFRVVNATLADMPFKIDESNTTIYSATISRLYKGEYAYGHDLTGVASYAGQLTDERSSLKFTINSGEPNASMYLDYFEIEYRKELKAFNDELFFFSKDTTAVVQYLLSNFSSSDIQVYDVTDYSNLRIISGSAINLGQCTFQSAETAGAVNKYLAISSSDYKTPSNGQKISNSNVKGNLSGTEMIVISNKAFKAQADAYVLYRTSGSTSKLSTSVFYVDEIFNEFSGGLQDPSAIRDFLKYAYDNWQVKPFYVLLFGDGDYDYLNIEKLNKNFVPTYQTAESLDEIASYPADDFYTRISGSDYKDDLAIGRLNVQSADDADIALAKIRKYESAVESGLWRNTITLVADDGWTPSTDNGSLHTNQSENLSKYRIPAHFDQNKLYLAAYPTSFTGSGRRKPEVNTAIINAANEGTLLLNYIGHGSPDVWADEDVFDKATSIPKLVNDKYFFLTAATCDFGKYDDPAEQSSSEILVLKKDGGAIGALTSARIVYSDLNAALNDTFYTHLFRSKDPGNLPYRLGKSFFLMKQTRYQSNDEKFHLLCDPALRLDEPRTQVVIDSINGTAASKTVQLSALSEVTIKGRVLNSDGSTSGYSGETIISVFDSDRPLALKEINYTVTMQGGLIFRGRTSVSSGAFAVSFVVPKDISYENKNGRIVAYVYNNTADGVGFTNNFLVGGTNPNAQNDGRGPVIQIYFDDPTNVSSYLVNSNFKLIAKLNDQTGLNTTGSGIGHKLEGILNDDENNAYDFTNYFIGDLNSGGKSGVIEYPFTDLQPGDYKIKVKAWDVFNNFSSEEAYFTVVGDSVLTIRNVVNFPNPFSSNTTFTFQHNLTKPINVKIKVYTVAGRLIKELAEENIVDKFVKIDWDGRDEDGNNIANGTYLYKLIVGSVDGEFGDTVLGKLAVIH